jgi:1-acyl-sn-glycerol-3-phosphate acyltransferase
MTFFIRLYRITALLLWAVFVALLTVPYQFKSGWTGVKRISRFTHLWSKGIAKIVNLRVKVCGEIPSFTGGLVVSNHLSYLDIITHGSVLPLRYSPKADIAKWPILGPYIGLSRPIWTDRESRRSSIKTLRAFAKTMKHGMHLIVYPEGTSTDGRRGILPFKSTSFEAAIIGNAPILPVLINYKEASGSQPICWYGDMTLLPHVWGLLRRRSIEARLRFLPPIYPEGRSRKELASFVHDIMAREYRKHG